MAVLISVRSTITSYFVTYHCDRFDKTYRFDLICGQVASQSVATIVCVRVVW